MSDRQWAAVMLGDESYAGARSFFVLKEAIQDGWDLSISFPPIREGQPRMSLFGHYQRRRYSSGKFAFWHHQRSHRIWKAIAVDCTIDEANDTMLEIPFREMWIWKTGRCTNRISKEKIPAVVLTITNNTAGGQPVSMQNIRETSLARRKYGVPLLIDSACFCGECLFYKTREKGYENKTIVKL